MNKAFLSIGTNIGSRKSNLKKTISMIQKTEGIVVSLESSIYETSPLINPHQDKFLNKVVLIETKLSPTDLLNRTQSIESAMGRKSDTHNMPRIIDIDILVFGDEEVQTDSLILPHPEILNRRFVLEPWNEIAPDYIIKGQDLSIKGLYNKYLGNRFKNQKVDLINY